MEGKGKDRLGISMAFLAFFWDIHIIVRERDLGDSFFFESVIETLGFVDRSRIEGVEV
jgi:hypothetical protein